LDQCSFDTKRFDVVYHSDVISHFYDPIAEFHEIYRILKPHGILFFETGNFAEVNEKYYSAYSSFQFPDHLYFFGERNLRDLLHVCGFELEQIYRFSILPQLAIIRYIRTLHKIARLTRSPFVWIAGKIGGIFSFRWRFPTSSGAESRSEGRIKRVLNYSHRYAITIIRYRLGFIVPKKGRPQTLIVTARRRA